jgi:hypothetical protein
MKKQAEECYSHENISLRLSNYDDIFSSFDPRPYSERSLSVDFLGESKRASIDKPTGDIEIRLMLPDKLRNTEKERIIKGRLKNHFERHAGKIREQYKRIVRTGAAFTVSGIFIMFLATLVLFSFPGNSLFFNFLTILFEPAGWFLFWEGLDQILFETKKIKPELDFYDKMTRSDVIFLSC